MKTSIFFVLILSTLSGLAQNSGSGFSFQAIARDASGAIRKNEPIVIQFSLLKGSATGEAQWVETHSVNTDLNGIFSVIIGKGERQTSIQDTSFTQLNFTTTNYWLKTEIKEGQTFRFLSNEQLQSVPYAENAESGENPGTIYAFAGTEDKIPEGWLLCDGRSFATNVYPALYSAIGGAWGFQEGGDLLALDSFNIPDLRGMFLRGVSGNSGNDPDTLNRTYSRPGGNEYNKVGSIQKDAIQNHLHYRSMSHSSEWCWTPPPPTGNGLGWNEYSVQQQPNYTSGDINIEAVPGGGGSARVSAESRPVNVYVIYIIKYR